MGGDFMERNNWRGTVRLLRYWLGPLLLAGCGGGSGSGTGDNGTAVVPGAPSSPLPTPTPSPTQSPALTYANAFDFSRDRSFQALGASLRVIRPFNTNASEIESVLQPNDSTISASYTAGTGSILVRYEGVQSTVSGAPATRSDSEIAWTQGPTATSRSEVVAFVPPLPRYQSIIWGRFATQTTLPMSAGVEDVNRLLLAGSSTVPADIPTIGGAGFAPILRATAQTTNGPRLFSETGNVTMRVEYATRIFTASIPYLETGSDPSRAPETGGLTFSGTLNPITNEVSGSVYSYDTSWSGAFTGRLYGPGGDELGVIFAMRRAGDGARAVGELAGKR